MRDGSLIINDVAPEAGYGHDRDLRRLLHSGLSMIDSADDDA